MLWHLMFSDQKDWFEEETGSLQTFIWLKMNIHIVKITCLK